MVISTEGDKGYVEEFVRGDPYVKNKVVEKAEVKELEEVQSRKKVERLCEEFAFRS